MEKTELRQLERLFKKFHKRFDKRFFSVGGRFAKSERRAKKQHSVLLRVLTEARKTVGIIKKDLILIKKNMASLIKPRKQTAIPVNFPSKLRK